MPEKTSRPKAAPKSIDVKLDLETAADMADFFAARGKPQPALQTYSAILKLDPHFETARRRYAELLLRVNGQRTPPGSLERGRMLLSLLGLDVLTDEIETEYFGNLEQLLSQREARPRPGTLVLGLGSGRCGSTSLAHAIAGVEGACATHENPPLVHWQPTSEQLRFHGKRFRLLRERFELVFDSAHWWLNAVEPLAAQFDDLKMIALLREPEACARSFLERKGRGRGAINHWVDHDGAFWKPALWDRLYPSYEPGRFGLGQPEGLMPEELASRQQDLVQAYVEDYNEAVARLQERLGERLLILRTEALCDKESEVRLQEHLGLKALNLQGVLNRGTLQDGDDQDLRF